VTTFEFRSEPDIAKTLGLSVGEEIMMMGCYLCFDAVLECDERTDGRTSLWCSNTSACIACYSTALVKMIVGVQGYVVWNFI